MESDLPPENASKKPTDCKENQQTAQVPPANGDKITHPRSFWDLFDNIFKMLEGVAFVSWMIQEYILPHNQIFLFIAILTALAGVFYLLAHKILPHHTLSIVLCWLVYGCCIFLIAKNAAESKEIPVAIAMPTPSASTAITVPKPDYIEGTEFTHKDLENAFPYGYAVIFMSDLSKKGRDTHQVFNTGLAEWNVDWDNVKITPNIADGTVAWHVPGISFKIPNNNNSISQNVKLADGTVDTVTPFKKGSIDWRFFGLDSDQPILNVVTLSANQRSPVFAIGFRIPTKDEEKNNRIIIP